MTGIAPIEPYPMPTEADLPGNVATWRTDPDRAVLLIHDMQRYFLRPFPADAAPGRELIHNATRLRDACRPLGVPVAYTVQPGGMSPAERGLLASFWGPGMRGEPIDRQVVEALAPQPDDWVLTKWRYSAFFRSDLLARMRAAGRDQLFVCGVYAHIGILMTAVEAFTNDIQTFLAADAVADFSADYHKLALRYAAERCAVVTTTADLVAGLAAGDRGGAGADQRKAAVGR